MNERYDANHYRAPRLWTDGDWLRSRGPLVQAFEHIQVTVSLVGCEWIDLQPMLDLLVRGVALIESGGHLSIEVDPESTDLSSLRTLRFLIDNGFFVTLAGADRGRITVEVRDYGSLTIDEFLNKWPVSLFPPRLLDYETLLPCTVVNASQLITRAAVFDRCKELKEEYLSGRARAFRMSPQLIYEARVFFDAVLPELLDNTRIHKTGTPWCALYARYRRREEISLSPRGPQGLDARTASEFDQRTRHLWNSDLVEACYVDMGVGIQESWINCWKARNKSRRRIPRLGSGRRVDGPNGAVHILHGVFTENASSLTPEERRTFDLHSNLTGLHSIKQSIEDSDWNLSVRSGANYVILSSKSSESGRDDAPQHVEVKGAGRVPPGDGVQYLFRFSATQDRILAGWLNAVPASGAGVDSQWWMHDYPSRFDRCHVVDNWSLPALAEAGDVILLRPKYFIGKGQLLKLLAQVEERGLNVVFCEIPEATALRIYLLLSDLIEYDNVRLVIPVITNSQYLNVPGPRGQALARSFSKGSRSQTAWWGPASAAVRNPCEVFSKCRQHDSRQFWATVENDRSSFLKEAVKWNDGQVLKAGYLSFTAALRHRQVRKALRKRLLVTLHALRAPCLVPGSNQLRYLTNDLRRVAGFDDASAARIAVLTNVHVTGATTEAATRKRPSSRPFVVPAFVYPGEAIEGSPSSARTESDIRALDWSTFRIESDAKPRYSRIGKTGRVRPIADGVISINALQDPSIAYRVWQQHGMLRIGHFSHTRHHLFVWVDLVAFLNGKTADSNDMVARIAHEVDSIGPHAIFYAPNDVSEVLVDRLIDYVRHSPALIRFPTDRIFPITSILDFSNLQTGHVGVGADGAVPPTTESAAVFLDDVVLSGATANAAQNHLLRLGYKSVDVVAILDRSEASDDFVLQSGKFLRWWSLGVRSLGAAHACAFCRGIDALTLLASQTTSETIREALDVWADRWAEKDSLRYEISIDEVRLPKESKDKRKLGSEVPNIPIDRSNALAVWAFEVINRLRFYGYIHDKPRPHLDPVLLELACGMVFMHWHDMSHDHQRQTLLLLASQMWNEDRERSRELIVIAFASLPRVDATMALDILEQKIGAAGLPHLDVALCYYALLHVAVPDRRDRLQRISYLMSGLRRQSSQEDTPADRGAAILTLLTGLERGSTNYGLAVRVLGLPTGRRHHQYLHYALEEIRKAEIPTGTTSSLVREIRALLEPVRTVIAERRALILDNGLSEGLDRAFGAFDEALLRVQAPPGRERDRSYRRLRTACAELYDLLILGSVFRPSLRHLLGLEYVHYLPFVLRSTIRQLIDRSRATKAPLQRSDFMITVPEVPEESMLLATSDDQPALMESLQNYDVVCCDKQYLVTALRDLLMDVVHARTKGRRLQATNAFMSIGCHPNGQDYKVIFESPGTTEEASAADDGRTLRSIRFLLQEQQGTIEVAFDKRRGLIRKTLTLPLFRQRQPGEMIR